LLLRSNDVGKNSRLESLLEKKNAEMQSETPVVLNHNEPGPKGPMPHGKGLRIFMYPMDLNGLTVLFSFIFFF
jgi:hypothetical protein